MPDFVDGNETTELKTIAENHSKQWIDANSLSARQVYNALVSKAIQFQQPEKIEGKLFHHRRNLDDGQLLFLVNTSIDSPTSTFYYLID